MSRAHLRSLIPLAAVALGLGLTACGGSADSGSTTSAAQSAAATSAPASPTESPTTAGPGTTVDVKSASYSKTFTVTDCTPTQGGNTGVVLDGTSDAGATLRVEAPDGTGTIKIGGGSEQDAIELSGKVSKATVSDAAVTVSGSFGGGETFMLTGYCA